MNKPFTKLLLSVASVAGLLYPVAASATNLAELPLKASVLAKPNVIFVMDDSGSLDWETMLATDNGTVWWDYNNKTAWNSDGSLIATDNGTNRDFLGYLFPSTYGTASPYLDTFNQSWYGVPPTPQFASLRSADYHRAYFNPDPSNTYDDWPPGHDGTTQSDYPPVSIANALASPPSVLAPYRPNSSTTIDLLKDRWAQITMLKGMVIPAGAKRNVSGTWTVQSSDTQVTSTTESVQVPYYPATYWKKVVATACTGTDVCTSVPEGGTTYKLKRFEIRRTNYTTDAAFKTDIQRFANWFTYYRKRVLLMGGSMGKVLETLNGMRVGVVSLNRLSPVTMYDLDSATNSRNGVRVSGIFYANPASGSTPTQGALAYAFTQFQRTDTNGDLSGGKVIQFACQRNASFLITDGFYNGSWVTPPTYDKSKWGGASPFANIVGSTLADQALAYYTLNPRPDLPTGRVPSGDPNAQNPDINNNLHVNFYATTLNIPGVLWDGVATYPSSTFTWPSPVTDTRSAIDDIWHATINGRGKMYNVADPAEAALKIDAGLRDILSQVAAQGGVAVSSVNLDSTGTSDAKAYLGKYNPSGWTGDLEARPISPVDASISDTTLSWTDSSGNPATAGSLLAARDWTTRFMFTSNGSASGGGMEFTSANVGATVNPDTTKYTNAQVVDYLRGNRTGEGWSGESVIFRRRSQKNGLLGPVVNAEPALSLSDKVVYLASGEGFLHAFDTDSGQELWAFSPYDSLTNLGATVQRGYTYQTKLDGTPAIGQYSSSGKVLVAGMGAAGRSYYALDVTSPRPASQSAAAAQVKWMFPAPGSTQRSQIGYTVGKPLLVRLPDNTYVALVTSGYDNGTAIGDGKGRLWMLNAATGAVLKTWVTSVGAAGDEAGLAQIAGALESDGSVRYVYGGDLKGNLYRFDLTQSGSGELSPLLLAQLKDGSGNVQPVTAAPALVQVKGQRIVLVGTGRILDITDFGSTTTNTFYAISDTGVALGNARSSLVQRAYTRTSTSTGAGTTSGSTIDWTTQRGWYMDLPAGEHENTRPTVAGNAVTFVTNTVGATDCSASSYLYLLDVQTGFAQTPLSVSYMLSNVTNSSGALVVKIASGELKAIGQYYDPVTSGTTTKATWGSQPIPYGAIPSGKNAWREILKQ